VRAGGRAQRGQQRREPGREQRRERHGGARVVPERVGQHGDRAVHDRERAPPHAGRMRGRAAGLRPRHDRQQRGQERGRHLHGRPTVAHIRLLTWLGKGLEW